MEIFRVVRMTMNLFFITLPMILVTICIFFAAGVGNLGMGMLAIGQIVILPLAVYAIRIVTSLLPERVAYKPATDIGQLVTSHIYLSDKLNVAPSFWIAHVVFFFSYLFSNALDVFKIPPATDTPTEEWRVENRKARASMIMGLTVFMLIFLVMMRALVTDLETPFGIAVGLVSMIPLGYGWYRVADLTGANKMDIFGIVQQMVPVTDDTNITYCIPPAKA